ncbi:MAG: SH3 domain-containing protein, partial [Planctomycetota bacterium]
MITRERAGGALICLALTGPLLNSALSAPTANIATGPIAVRVNVSTELNVRTSPSTSGAILATAKNGAIYAAVAKSGDFYKVWFAGRVAYMHGSYLEDAANARVTVTASALNVRTGAGTNFSTLGQAPSGSVYTVLASSGVWRRIQFGIAQGWVHSDYLRASKAGDGNSGGSTGGGSTGGGSTGGSTGGYVSNGT